MVGNAFVVQALEFVWKTMTLSLTLHFVQSGGIITAIIDTIAKPSFGNASTGILTLEFQVIQALVSIARSGFIRSIIAIRCTIAFPMAGNAIPTETFELVWTATKSAITFIGTYNSIVTIIFTVT